MTNRYIIVENIPFDWEIVDTWAIPPRTFACNIPWKEAVAIRKELNELNSQRESYNE